MSADISAIIPEPPLGVSRSNCYRVWVDGMAITPYRARLADYVILPCTAPRDLVVEVDRPLAPTALRLLPQNAAPVPSVSGNRLAFTIRDAGHLHLEVDGCPDLLIKAYRPQDPPQEAGVRVFGPGLHRHELIEIASGETLWLAAGAVLQARLIAEDGERITIAGPGVLDGSPHRKGECRSNHMMHFRHCRDVTVRGVTVVDSSGWNIVPYCCDDVRIHDVAILGPNVTSDGIDICASRQVTVSDCYLRTNDDCVAIKGPKRGVGRVEPHWETDVVGVVVERCICYNEPAGNVFEIGFETACERIRDIVFRDCDVLAAHGEGGVFTIHAGDRALIEQVRYEDIRVEHFYGRFVDFTVLHSRYSVDQQRGRIRDVTLRGIRGIEDRFNTPSLIGGWDADHDVRGIRFEDLRLGERHIDSLDALHAFTRNAGDITFR